MYGSFGGGPFDVINLGNLNVHYSIPVLHKAGRGLPFNYDLTYDSSIWTPVTSDAGLIPTTQWYPSASWGWTGGIAPIYGYVSSIPIVNSTVSGSCNITTTTNSNYAFHDPSGGVHYFTGTTSTAVNYCTGTTNSGNLTTTANDGSAYKLSATPLGVNTVTSASGHQYVSNCSSQPCWTWGTWGMNGIRTDTNGNRLAANVQMDRCSILCPARRPH